MTLPQRIQQLRDALAVTEAAQRSWDARQDDIASRALDNAEYFLARACRDHLPAVLDALESALSDTSEIARARQGVGK